MHCEFTLLRVSMVLGCEWDRSAYLSCCLNVKCLRKDMGLSASLLLLLFLFLTLLPVAWTCTPQKADYVMVSCFPNTIIAHVPECPYGWEIAQLSLGGICYNGVNSPGYYRFSIPDLTPRNHSYCGTQSEYIGGKDPKYVFYNSIVSNDSSLTVRNQPVNYTFSCTYRAAYLVNNAVFSQRVATVYVNNGSIGSFKSQLSMNVFTNSKFLYAKDAPYVIDTSEIGSEVFIGIEAKGLSNRFKVVISNCWATPSPYATDKKRWSLIINSCPSDNTVTIFDNAKDSRSTFKFNSFRFQRLDKVSTVWLHCDVQLCDGEKLYCQPIPCTARSVRSDPELSGGILTTEFHVRGELSSSYRHLSGVYLYVVCIVFVSLLGSFNNLPRPL